MAAHSYDFLIAFDGLQINQYIQTGFLHFNNIIKLFCLNKGTALGEI